MRAREQGSISKRMRWAGLGLLALGLISALESAWGTGGLWPWAWTAPALAACAAVGLLAGARPGAVLAGAGMAAVLALLGRAPATGSNALLAVAAVVGMAAALLRNRAQQGVVPVLTGAGGVGLLLVAALLLMASGPGQTGHTPRVFSLLALAATGLWLLSPLKLASSDIVASRLPPLAVAAQAGVALLVLVGWLVGASVVVQGGTDAVPMPFNAALCHLLAAGALWFARYDRPRIAVALLAPPVLIASLSLMQDYLGRGLGIDEFFFAHHIVAERVAPGRMAPNAAVTFLIGAVATLLMLRAGLNPRRWLVIWAIGLIITISAVIVLAGYLLDVPQARGWGSQTPMSLMAALGFAAYGLGVLFAGRAQVGSVAHQTLWLPILVFGGSVALALLLSSAVAEQRQLLARQGNELRADAMQHALQDRLAIRLRALERLAETLGVLGAAERERLLRVGARASMRDFPSMVAMAWVDGDMRVRWTEARAPELRTPVGGALDGEPRRREALQRAASTGAPQFSEPFALPDGSQGAMVALPLRAVDEATRDDFLTVDLALPRLFERAFEGLLTQPLRIRHGDAVLYERHVPADGRRLLRRQVQVYDERWEIDIWSDPAASSGRLSGALLFGAILAGGWLALALRFGGLARERARQAEASHRALERELVHGERLRTALTETQGELGNVLESISDAFYLLDADWRFVFLNSEAARLQQSTREALLGRVVWEAFPEAGAGPIRVAFERAVREQVTYVDEIHYPPLGAWFDVRAYPHPKGLAVYFRDITQAKEAQLSVLKLQVQSERAQVLARLGSWELDLRTGARHWSAQSRAIFGVAADVPLPDFSQLLEKVHPEDRAAAAEATRRLLAGEGDIDLEYRVRDEAGELRYAHELGSLVRDEQGVPILATGAMQDITERKRAEHALRETTQRLNQTQSLNRLIIDNSLDVICAVDGEGRFVQVNSACQRLWGFAPDELIGRVCLELVHPDDRARTSDIRASIMAGTPVLDFRNRYLHRDGRVVVTQWSAIWSEPDRLMFAVARDVTAIERQEAHLVALKDGLLRAQQVARMGSWELSIEDDRLTWSDEVYRIFGVRKSEFTGRLDVFSARTHPEDVPALLTAQDRALRGEAELDLEHRIMWPDGRERYVHQRGRLLRNAQGDPWRLAGSVQDVTERKRSEEVLRRNESLLRIAGRVARIGAWLVTLKEGRVVWSDEVCAIHEVPGGTSPSVPEAIGYYAPEYRDQIEQVFECCARDGTSFDEEVEIISAQGRRLWVRVIGEAVRGTDGSIARVQGAFQDIGERKSADAVLRESELRFKLVAKATTDTIWDWNLLDDTLWWNEGIHTQFGYPLDRVPPTITFWSERVHPEDHDRIVQSVQAGTESAWQEEYRFRRHDGAYAWVLDRGFVIRDAQGRAIRMVGGMTDLTERRHAERALEKEQVFLLALLDNLTEGVVACDEKGTLTAFNRASREFHGLPEASLPPERWAEHYRLYEADGGALLTRERVPLFRALRGERVVDAEIMIAPTNKPALIVACSGQPIVSASGEWLGAVIAMHDITARKRAARLDAQQREILIGIAARRPLGESLDALVRLYDAQHAGGLCSVLLLDEVGERVLHGAAPSLPDAFNQAVNGQPIGPAAGSCGTAAWRGERVQVDDIASDPLWTAYAPLALAHGLQACWSTPVKSSEGKVLATFAVYHRTPRAPTDAELATMDRLVAVAAIAIEHGLDYRRLALSEQRFRSLFEEHPDAVYSMDLAGRFTACNVGFERVTGRGSQAAVGHFFDEAVAPGKRDFVRAQFTAAASGSARTFEMQTKPSAERRIDLRVTALPIVVDGEVTGVFGIAQDITELRQRERELGAALERAETASGQLRRLSEAAVLINQSTPIQPIYEQLVELLRNTIGAHQALLMLAPTSIGGSGTFATSLSDKYAAYRSFRTPPDGSGIYALVEESNRPLRLSQSELEAHPRWRGFGKHAGEHPPMRGWLAVPLVATDGRNLGTLQLTDKFEGSFSADDEAITVQFAQMASTAIERAALFEKLRERDRFFEKSQEAFVIFDPAREQYLQVNPALEQISGYSREELCSQNFRNFIHVDDHPAANSRQSRRPIVDPTEPTVLQFESRWVRKDGETRWMEWISVDRPGELIYGVGRDITERRRVEQALQQAFEELRVRNRELQDFAFVASHDLQEPLRKIRAFSDRLQSHYAHQLDAQARDYLDRTANAAARMQGLIDDLLAYSRINSRSQPFAPVDLNRVAAEVLEDLEARLESSGGRVDLGPLPTLDGDSTQLRQLLQNLIANALKFRSPERPPLVRIEAVPARMGDGRGGWEIRIHDNGIGFEPQYAERIFAPFQRLHGRSEYEGTGIGLAIVRRIVERHHGSVRAEGRPEEGSTFIVMLPERQLDPVGGSLDSAPPMLS